MGGTDRFVGKNQVLLIDGSEIGPLKEVTLSKMIDTVESTAGSDGYKSYIATTRAVTATIRYVSEGTLGDQVGIAMLEPDGTLRSFQYGPEGTTSGTHMAEWGSGRIKSHDMTAAYDGLVEMTATFESSGSWVKNRETDVW